MQYALWPFLCFLLWHLWDMLRECLGAFGRTLMLNEQGYALASKFDLWPYFPSRSHRILSIELCNTFQYWNLHERPLGTFSCCRQFPSVDAVFVVLLSRSADRGIELKSIDALKQMWHAFRQGTLVYMYTYIHIYIYVRVYIYTYTYTHIYIYTYMHTCI